ncbi:MAG: Gfo/Idh/MocA family oxidoreductase [Bacteroidia bacterium]|nr:Gfo/Idh/MocA family oxidoreductase [Bacteroidia bacterium]MDW8015926.1 Gfo/Idh/MocA family oxidoreductase [Bacteroidia bacterium]
MKAPLRLGIVGVGRMGGLHLQKALHHPSIQVVALYDTNPTVVQRLMDEGLPVVSSYEEVLERAEGIIIASPTHTHASYAELALRSQKHILIEKPATLMLKELEDLIALQEEAGVVALVGHVERFNPAFRALQPYRSELQIFSFERIAPWTPRGTDASVVMDLLIHDLDLFWALTEGYLAEVRVSACRLRSAKADSIQVWIDLTDGRGASFLISRIAPQKRRRIIAHGPSLWAEADLLLGTLSLWSLSATEDPLPLTVPLPYADALMLQLEHFLQCIQEGIPSTLSLQHVYPVMVWVQQVEMLAERRLVFAP